MDSDEEAKSSTIIHATFKLLFNSLFKKHMNTLQYHGASSRASMERRASSDRRPLHGETEFVVFLTVLRRGLNQKDLAFRLGVSQPSISRLWNTWRHLTNRQLVQVPIWQTRDYVRQRLPSVFEEHFPDTRAIFDCTDFCIEIPSSFRAQNDTFSQCKNHNTAKGIVFVAPHGSVIFASAPYVGRL